MPRDSCAYPGHAMKWECTPDRFIVTAPPDKRGRVKTFSICYEALVYALARGYVPQCRNAGSDEPPIYCPCYDCQQEAQKAAWEIDHDL